MAKQATGEEKKGREGDWENERLRDYCWRRFVIGAIEVNLNKRGSNPVGADILLRR